MLSMRLIVVFGEKLLTQFDVLVFSLLRRGLSIDNLLPLVVLCLALHTVSACSPWLPGANNSHLSVAYHVYMQSPYQVADCYHRG